MAVEKPQPGGEVEKRHSIGGIIFAAGSAAAEGTYGTSLLLGKNIPGSGTVIRYVSYLPEVSLRTSFFHMTTREAVGAVLLSAAGATIKKTFFPKESSDKTTSQQ